MVIGKPLLFYFNTFVNKDFKHILILCFYLMMLDGFLAKYCIYSFLVLKQNKLTWNFWWFYFYWKITKPIRILSWHALSMRMNMNTYQSNTYRRDINCLHSDNEPSVWESQQKKDQQSYVPVSVLQELLYCRNVLWISVNSKTEIIRIPRRKG